MENKNTPKNHEIVKHDGSAFALDLQELDKFNKKLKFQTFIKSYIWIIVPACVIVFAISLENYNNAAGVLTPYSVNVDSYHRNDGTFVLEHYRRPPGGVIHDRPLKRTMFWTTISMFLSVVVSILSVLIYRSHVSDMIQENLTNFQRDVLHRNRKIVIENALTKAKIEFDDLSSFPRSLNFGRGQRCKFCRSYISEYNLCIFFKAQIHTHYVCTGCINNRAEYGRNQKIIDYQVEIEHIKRLEVEFNNFKAAIASSIVGNASFTIQDLRKLFREFLVEPDKSLLYGRNKY